MWGWKGKD
ncbi:hypothetical protein E2C01_070609 [Portunus trituberculatus]|uniref:Uncharacterized protein n=1 Tax=Portunus trituberculatus TaxID=210409 RepID=A0A5B7HXR4_PORTR|nr:hypothetical protein [Portunus trituberculatus]